MMIMLATFAYILYDYMHDHAHCCYSGFGNNLQLCSNVQNNMVSHTFWQSNGSPSLVTNVSTSLRVIDTNSIVHDCVVAKCRVFKQTKVLPGTYVCSACLSLQLRTMVHISITLHIWFISIILVVIKWEVLPILILWILNQKRTGI